jgi:signal transduction histidine kinase/ligand-binding sensor domain-containing protein
MGRPAVWILLSLTLTACLPSELSAQYHFDHWTTANGLPENSIWAIRQTRDGYVWMTTSSGMVRFDGVRFREFNRANTPGLTAEGFSAYALLEDREGCLWAGTYTAGAVRYCHGVFTTLTTKDGLPANRVVRIDEDEEGTVWLFSEPGLSKWKDGRVIRLAPEPGSPFNDVLTAPRDRVGVDGYLFGLWRIGKNRWQRFARGHWSEFPLPASTRDGLDLRIDSIVEDSKQRLWYKLYRDPGKYYCLYQGQLTTFAGMPPESYVSYQDVKGTLWESAFDGHTSIWKDGKATPLNVFSTGYVFRGFEDQEGSLWLGTARTGLFRASPALIATHRNIGGPDLNVIESVMEDSAGGIWYGSHGLFHLSNGRVRAFYHAGAVPRPHHAGGALGLENIICALYQDHDGTVWAGTWDGVAHLSGKVMVSDGPTAGIRGKVRAIHRARNGDLWVGSERGLYRLQGTTLTHFTHKDGLGSDDVQVIREGRSGALWVGTSAGLSIREGETFSPVGEKQGPDNQNITALYEDGTSVLWIGTYSLGLYRLESGKLTHFMDSNGLSTNSVFQILEDDKGYLWLSGRSGIHRVKKQELNAFSAGEQTFLISTAFGTTDGMISVECSGAGQPTGIKAKDGKLWFPTSDGLAVLDPLAAQVNPHPPPVLIEDALVDGRGIARGGAATLGPGQLSLDIQYTALSFIKSGQIRFRYRMEGLDPDWIDAGARRTAYYTRIPPGNYTFRVIAANSDGVWNTEGARLAVRVLPPFYQTWWFEVAASLAAVTLIVAAWRYRVSQLERAQAIQQAFSRQLIASQEEERKRIAAELHDSLGQRLVIVRNLALFFLRAQGETAVNSGKLRSIEEISAEAALAIDETREISYNLRPFQLDRLGLTKAIQGIVRTASAASATSFSLELDNIDDVFPEELRIYFFRIVQESVNNIVKHAQATEVCIQVKRTADQLLLTIRDNGRGFTPGTAKSESERGGFGITGMAERARALGGELTVQAAPARGTVVSVRIQLGEKSR